MKDAHNANDPFIKFILSLDHWSLIGIHKHRYIMQVASLNSLSDCKIFDNGSSSNSSSSKTSSISAIDSIEENNNKNKNVLYERKYSEDFQKALMILIGAAKAIESGDSKHDDEEEDKDCDDSSNSNNNNEDKNENSIAINYSLNNEEKQSSKASRSYLRPRSKSAIVPASHTADSALDDGNFDYDLVTETSNLYVGHVSKTASAAAAITAGTAARSGRSDSFASGKYKCSKSPKDKTAKRRSMSEMDSLSTTTLQTASELRKSKGMSIECKREEWRKMSPHEKQIHIRNALDAAQDGSQSARQIAIAMGIPYTVLQRVRNGKVPLNRVGVSNISLSCYVELYLHFFLSFLLLNTKESGKRCG